MEYMLPESDWVVIIQYSYCHDPHCKRMTKEHEDAMDNLDPIGFAKDDKGFEEYDEDGNKIEEEEKNKDDDKKDDEEKKEEQKE